MPALKNTAYATEFATKAQEARAHGETNDCSVKAVSILTGLPYAQVHAAFAAAGRKMRKPTPHAVTDKALDILGFRRVPLGGYALYTTPEWVREIVARYPGVHKNLKGLTTHHPRRFAAAWAGMPDLLIEVRGHHLAFKDGEVKDWTVNSSRKIIRMDRIVPIIKETTHG